MTEKTSHNKRDRFVENARQAMAERFGVDIQEFVEHNFTEEDTFLGHHARLSQAKLALLGRDAVIHKSSASFFESELWHKDGVESEIVEVPGFGMFNMNPYTEYEERPPSDSEDTEIHGLRPIILIPTDF